MEQSQYAFNPEYNEPEGRDNRNNYIDNSANRKLVAWQYARSVKLFSFIDGIFCFFYLFYFYWPAVFTGLFIVAGYAGARNYKKNLILTYAFYELIDIGFRIYILYYIYTNYDAYYSYILNIIGIFIQLYICRIIFMCYSSFKALAMEELLELKGGWKPGRVVFLYW
jgi:hypothetical protein